MPSTANFVKEKKNERVPGLQNNRKQILKFDSQELVSKIEF